MKYLNAFLIFELIVIAILNNKTTKKYLNKLLHSVNPYFYQMQKKSKLSKQLFNNSFFSFKALKSLALLLPFTIITLSAEAQRKNKDKEEMVTKLEAWQIDTLIQPIPMNRVLFTDKVSLLQTKLDLRDGEENNYIHYINPERSNDATKGLLTQVSLMEIHIENMNIDHGAKIRYHRAVESMLNRVVNTSWGSLPSNFFTELSKNLEDMFIADYKGELTTFVTKNINESTYFNRSFLDDNHEAKTAFYKNYGLRYPEKMIKNLEQISKEPYADDIVAAVAKINPGTIMTYATSTTFMSGVMRRNQDPLVKTIVKIADESSAPLKLLPFLGEVHSGKLSVKAADAFINNDVEYYKKLVELKLSNPNMASKEVNDEVEYRAMKFVKEINDLHESPDPVRFKCLQPFGAADLYYIMIAGRDEIYTSSFTRGTFPLMLERMKPKKGDEFLEQLRFDQFRIFIRMSAGYNTLSNFFATMDSTKKIAIMKDFVANLEQGDENDLSAAVDVADAYGSLKDENLKAFIRSEIKSNYERTYNNKNKNSKKGVTIYGLLGTIFNPDLSAQENLPIPPVTYVPYSSLLNDKNEIVIQAFFYGDEDGAMSFGSFKSNFNTPQWKSTQNKYWVTYTNTSGKNPIIIYANLPLKEPEDEDAQNALYDYLLEKGITPTMMIHRGHSYHLSGSLESLSPQIKVVMLGSCGGYQNLANVLNRSPEANIISSKQVGAARINEPIIAAMLKDLLAGNDINWTKLWNGLDQLFAKQGKVEQDLYSDYVPPHKNLGAIFIKAYRKMMAE